MDSDSDTVRAVHVPEDAAASHTREPPLYRLVIPDGVPVTLYPPGSTRPTTVPADVRVTAGRVTVAESVAGALAAATVGAAAPR